MVRVINLKNNDEIAAIAKVEMDKDVEESDDETPEPSELRPGEVDSDFVEFKKAPQTGDNAVSNMGDAAYLKKLEQEEERRNKKIEEEKEKEDNSDNDE